jgi:hypothetical protein
MASQIPTGDCTVTTTTIGNNYNFSISLGSASPITVNYKNLYDNFRVKIASVPACQSILTSNRITSFETLNAAINYGDSIKDGTSAGEMATLHVFDFVVPTTTAGAAGFNLAQLKTFAHAVKDHLIQRGEITRVAFARDKKGDESAKKRWESVRALCAFDSGLGLNAWLNDKKTKIFTSFGKYIDPSTSRGSDYVFPQIGRTLSISKDAFTQLGYGPYCNLTSAICHDLKSEKYTYDMTVNSHLPPAPSRPVPIIKIDPGQVRDADPNKDSVFPGNKVKKSFSGDQKFVSVVMKGLGDKLQVFLAFILKNVIGESNNVVCVATCDEIVLLFCTLMNVPCWFTSIGVENKIKVNEVLYYNQDNNSQASVKKRIVSEHKVVDKGYDDLILLIGLIQSQGAHVQASGDNKLFVFSAQFYDMIIHDLQIIRQNIQTVYNDAVNTRSTHAITALNMYLYTIQTAAVNNFFRVSKDNLHYSLIRTANKYNSSGTTGINVGISKTDKRTFFDIAMQDYPISQSGGALNLKGGTIKADISEFFDDNKLNVYVKLDDIVHKTNYDARVGIEYIEHGYIENLTSLGKFDAGKRLRNEIFEISKSFKIPEAFHWDVLSDVLHQLNFNDCRTTTLERLVNQFKLDCLYSTGKNFNQLRSELDLKKIKSHKTPARLMSAQRRRANRLSNTRSVQSYHSQVMRTNSVPVIGQNSVLKRGHAERAKEMRKSTINNMRGIATAVAKSTSRGGRSTRKKHKNN